MKTRTKRKRPIEKTIFGQMVDLNEIDWNGDGAKTSSYDLWLKQFEKSEVSQAEADAMFRRIEASNRKFPI